MGIKYLLQNLKTFDEVGMLQDYINEDYYENLKNIIGHPSIKSYICHVDFSIVMYKILLTSENMNIALNKIKVFLIQLKKYNQVYIYIDPKINLRKKKLQNFRNENKIKTMQRIKYDIVNSIKTNNLLINNKIQDMIQNDNMSNNYIQDLSFYMTNDAVVENNFVDNENQTDILKNIQKQTFSLFCNSYDFKYHKKYILKYLIDNKIITSENIIYSNVYDAEINIISNINNNNNTNNVIFSCDQDVLLFGLMYFKSKYIYIKNDINSESKSLILIKNSFLNTNIAYLTIFFNKSDYFNGINKFKITPIKLKKLYETHKYAKLLLSQDYKNKINLLATFLKFYTSKIITQHTNLVCVENYINNLNKYLSMDKLFYTSIYDIDNETELINLNMVVQYISKLNPFIYIYTTKLEKKFFCDD